MRDHMAGADLRDPRKVTVGQRRPAEGAQIDLIDAARPDPSRVQGPSFLRTANHVGHAFARSRFRTTFRTSNERFEPLSSTRRPRSLSTAIDARRVRTHLDA